jgi:hypothetical protein
MVSEAGSDFVLNMRVLVFVLCLWSTQAEVIVLFMDLICG